MAARIIVCSYGGDLICQNNSYTYKGGKSKTFALSVNTTYDDLLSKIYRIIKSTPNDHDINMKVIYPCSNQSIPPSEIEDDEDVRVFLAAQSEHPNIYMPLIIETVRRINETIHEDPIRCSGVEHNVDIQHDALPMTNMCEEHGVNWAADLSLKSECMVSPSPAKVYVTSSSSLPTSGNVPSSSPSLTKAYVDSSSPSHTRVPLTSYIPLLRRVHGSTSSYSPTRGHVYSSSPLRKTAHLPSSPEPLQTSNFMDVGFNVPLEDEAFVNADLSKFNGSLNESNEIAIGQTFKDKRWCQYVLSQFAMKNHFQYRVLYSSTKRYTVVCVEDNCQWRVHASRVNDARIFKIQAYTSKHTCGMSWMQSDHREASSKLASDLVISRIEQRMGLNPKDIVLAMHEKYHILMSYKKAWRAKEIAIKRVMGSYEDSYNELPVYLHELRRAT